MTEFAPKPSYTARDYATILDAFKKFIRETRPDLWSDLFDSNTGSALIQLMAMLGDNLSYGLDVVAAELFLATCRRYESALRIAKSVGYSARSAAPAEVTAKSLGFPDTLILNGGTIPKGSVLKGANGLSYELLEDYVIASGETVARVTLIEGSSFEEQFAPTSQKGQEVFASNGIVATGSWMLFIGDPDIGSNEWTEVDIVSYEIGSTKTYETYLDGLGRIHAKFGDGSSGKIPDDTITLRYRTTGGAGGNAPVGSIRGSLKVNLASPATGTVSVEFENRDTDLSVSEGTAFNPGESLGSTVASTTQTGTLANTPIVAGSVIITVALPGGAGTIVVQDNGAGVFTVVSNTSAFTLVTSAITYSTGGFSLQFSGTLPSAGPMTGVYYHIESGDAFSVGIIGAASGGADRETLVELKRNIPAYIRTQDKIITRQDYDDVLRRLAGIALVFTTRWISALSSNAVKVHVWASEITGFQSEDSNGTSLGALSTYTRYATVQRDKVNEVQAYLSSRTILTVQSIIFRPEMLWADIYLGDVIYDKRIDATVVRDAITAAVIKVFQDSNGFVVYTSELTNAVRDAIGVESFMIERIATGIQDTSLELQGVTPSGATVTGTLLHPIPTPKTVEITVEQTSSSKFICRDNGAGQFILVSGTATIVSSSINYLTGAWSIQFGASLIPNQQVLASYANVDKDYRHQQVATIDGSAEFDLWPPPSAPTSVPATPPYKDGVPVTVIRAGVAATTPYQTGDVATYQKLKDITVDAVVSTSHFYDETYQYNNEIYYDSTDDLTTDVRAINLRRLVFNLIAG